jgi:hypothetical protein
MQIRLTPNSSSSSKKARNDHCHAGQSFAALRSGGGACGVRFAQPRKPGSRTQALRNGKLHSRFVAAARPARDKSKTKLRKVSTCWNGSTSSGQQHVLALRQAVHRRRSAWLDISGPIRQVRPRALQFACAFCPSQRLQTQFGQEKVKTGHGRLFPLRGVDAKGCASNGGLPEFWLCVSICEISFLRTTSTRHATTQNACWAGSTVGHWLRASPRSCASSDDDTRRKGP